MSELEALIIGLVQGLTEYLPVSSSGHIAIGKALLGIDAEAAGGLTFDIVVHIATVLSTLVILWREVAGLFKGFFRIPHGGLNGEQSYILCIVISMIPAALAGLLFKEEIEALAIDNLMLVGCCLMVTAALLLFASLYRPAKTTGVTPFKAFFIGVAQAFAMLPGLSRSGSTIGAGLLLGCDKSKMAQFSFLMVIPVILGEALLDCKELLETGASEIGLFPLALGFLAAFISGCLACKFMIAVVKRFKLYYFALYCALVGAGCIIANLI